MFSSPRLAKQPLLELVQDQQHLLPEAVRCDPSASSPANRPAPMLAAEFRTHLAQALEQSGFRLLRGRLDVDRKDVLASRGKSPALTSDDLPQPDGP